MTRYRHLAPFLAALVAAFALLAPAPAAPVFAADKPLWVEATGESQMGEMDTLQEVRERARRDAQGKAVEEAVGTFIKSHTLVSNAQVAEDLVYAAVRGKIVQERVVAADWDPREKNRYRVTLRALVEPVYPEKGEGLWVKLTLSRTELREGDEVSLFYQVSQDAWVYIFSVAADGSVTLLLPNSTLPGNRAEAGKVGRFPPEGSPIRLKAMFLPDFKDAFAEERVKIIATRQREELLALGFKEGVFAVYDAHSTGLVSDLARRLNRIELSDWAEATATYRITR